MLLGVLCTYFVHKIICNREGTDPGIEKEVEREWRQRHTTNAYKRTSCFLYITIDIND